MDDAQAEFLATWKRGLSLGQHTSKEKLKKAQQHINAPKKSVHAPKKFKAKLVQLDAHEYFGTTKDVSVL